MNFLISFVVTLVVLALVAPGATAQIPTLVNQPQGTNVSLARPPEEWAVVAGGRTLHLGTTRPDARALLSSQPPGSCVILLGSPTLNRLVAPLGGGGPTLGPHTELGDVIIAPGTPGSCSGRVAGPGGSYLTLSTQHDDILPGIPGATVGSRVLVDGCFSDIGLIGFENRSPLSLGFYSVTNMTQRIRIEALGNVQEFDLLPNGSPHAEGIPAYDGFDDYDGASGVHYLTAPHGTFFQFVWQIPPGVDPSQPFPVRTTLIFVDNGGTQSAPCTFIDDLFGRGGMSFQLLAP